MGLDQNSEEMSGEMEDEMPQQETFEEPSAFTFTVNSRDMKRFIDVTWSGWRMD